MRSTFLSFLILCLSTSLFSQIKLNKKSLDKTLKALQEATQTVGFSVAVVQGSEVIYAKGFGYKDLEKKLQADKNTLFPIGSTSKAFTTALLGIMEEEKGLKFTDSPRKYLPELEFYNNELNNSVTILDMVSHRTGLPRHDYSWYLFPTESKDSLLGRVKHHEPFTGLREQWYYNNFMYLAQGLIAEKLSGKSWEDNIRDRFFGPLKMGTSNLSIAELKSGSNISKGYSLVNNKSQKLTPYYNIAAISPAGSINSSAAEMANWLKIWLNEGVLDGQQVLPKAYVQKAVNPLMLVGGGISDPQFPAQHLYSYGYAWFTSSYKGHYRLEHGGNIDGFSANVSFFPTDKIGIVVLANQDGSALPSLVRNAISDALLGVEKTDWVAYYEEKISAVVQQKSSTKESDKTQTTSAPNHPQTAYTGKYNHKGYGTFTIEVKNDSLWALFPREKAYLKHVHHDIFKPFLLSRSEVETEGMGFNFNFQTNDLGDIEALRLKLEPTLDPIIFTRTPSTFVLPKNTLIDFTGSYILSGTELKVFLKKEQLSLLVPGQPEYTLNPINDTEFVVDGLVGYKVEFTKNNNAFNLVLHQPNGMFTATKMK